MKKILIPIIIIIIMIIISVLYNTLPRMELNGKQNIIISYQEQYEEAGVIVKNAKGNYLKKVEIKSNIKEHQIGDYNVTYTLKIGKKKLQIKRNVKIIDNIPPKIELKGDKIIQIYKNSQYIEAGYSAYDEYDGNITNKVELTGEIKTNEIGTYKITYKVNDESNNTTQVIRTVEVIEQH